MNEKAASNIHLRDLLNIVFKRKYQIVRFFLATVVTVAIGTFLTEPVYKATAQILVKIDRGNVLTSVAGNQDSRILVEYDQIINSEIEILKSSSLAGRVINDLGGPSVIFRDRNIEELGTLENIKIKIISTSKQLIEKFIKTKKEAVKPEVNKEVERQTALAKFQKSLTVEAITDSNLILLNFKHNDSLMASTIINKLSKLYLDRHLAIHKTKKNYEFFRDQTSTLKNKLEASEKKLENFKSKYGIINFERQKILFLEQQAALKSDLDRTTSLEIETKKRIAKLRKQLASIPEKIPQQTQIDYNSQLISSLQARLVELEIQEKELKGKYTDNNRLVRNIQEEISMLRARIGEYETKQYGSSTSGINPIFQNLQQNLLNYEMEINAIEVKRRTLADQLTRSTKELTTLNEIEIEFRQIQRELESYQKNYRLYRAKFEESRISDEMDSEKMSNVSVIEAAYPPLEPIWPKKNLNMVLAILLGIFGGFGLSFLLEYLGDKIELPEDIEQILEVPVLTSIPELKKI